MAKKSPRQARDRYSNLFDFAPVSYQSLNEEGCLIQVNQAWLDTLGYAKEEVVGRWFGEFLTTQSMNNFKKNFPRFKALRETHGVEFDMSRKDSSHIIVSFDGKISKDKNGNFKQMHCIFQNITERRLAEQALEESEKRYRHLFENSPIGIYRTAPDGRILMANPALIQMLGYSSFEEQASHNLDKEGYGPSYSRKQFKEQLEREDETKGLETSWMKKDKSLVFVRENTRAVRDKDGSILYYDGTVEDITQRKQAEEELRRERDRAHQYLDLAGVIMVAIDTDQKITLINKKGCEVLEYNEGEIIGKNWFDNFIPERNRKEVKGIFEKLITGKIKPVEYVENKVLTLSGKEKIIAWHNAILKDETGNIAGTLSSGEDVTEKRKMETQLLQSEKLAAVGTLAYGIAHEFNNILAGMMVNAELGLTLHDPEKTNECFEAIVENCQRGSSITYSLLAMAGEKKDKKELTDITQTLRGVLSFTRRELEKANIKTVENFKVVPQILCDPAEFTEVFLNMITNARDAMHPQGGTLTIKLEPLEDNIRITFKDTGCGIPEEIKTKIFDPFVTSKGALGKNEIAGTGLGLFLSYGIIDKYKGRIEVDSKLGKGTTFTILIPVSKNLSSGSFIEREMKPSPEIRKKLNILLIDDEETICSILKKFLETKGHKVTASQKAKEGWEYFQRGKFDVVLSDITMPGMDGIELIKKIKEQDQSAKIIVITGHIQQSKEKEAKAAGADEFLIKPFRNELLQQTISKVLSS